MKYSRANRPCEVAQLHQHFRHRNPEDREGLGLTNVGVREPPDAAVSPRSFVEFWGRGCLEPVTVTVVTLLGRELNPVVLECEAVVRS